ncbi:hypothetical protein PHYSODRAFT_333344 [Phytophthora sojae]|uniref:Uncharacterized protein n=1 Tax=Phytophthora sojae (strain P6497) TaxID=1094619 RepID=G4ZNP5_PHYSP|nr:hypothetical protein PHYSODRAFT_333344 [Phytophthora sojae]EGZ15068.1 hypothetical protein PHYSODRAFT_333344 [Phytophthora sojae]|eukprot:XP_009528817.1 hypothetical protein PHYSODRAFT_333344 [Phytophthora sojae]
MLADIMTKPIAAPQFDALRTKLGIVVADESSGSVVKTDVTTPRQATNECGEIGDGPFRLGSSRFRTRIRGIEWCVQVAPVLKRIDPRDVENAPANSRVTASQESGPSVAKDTVVAELPTIIKSICVGIIRSSV